MISQEIDMALITCPECGNQVSSKANICPKCGFSLKKNISNNKYNKKIILFCCITLFFIVATLLIVFIVSKSNDRSLYEEPAWGISFENMKNSLKDKENVTINEENKTIGEQIEKFKEIDGVSGYILYEFDHDALSKVTTTFDIDENIITNTMLNRQLIEDLTALFGEPVNESVLSIRWESEHSKISVISLEFFTMLEFMDINYDEKEDESHR